jgi:hypothetical protein
MGNGKTSRTGVSNRLIVHSVYNPRVPAVRLRTCRYKETYIMFGKGHSKCGFVQGVYAMRKSAEWSESRPFSSTASNFDVPCLQFKISYKVGSKYAKF